MKPITLKIQGINSYRSEQTVDFTELTAYGLFGIFGPTGSGKSSILDAITLALYARLPRSTRNYINVNEKKGSVSFTFSITTDVVKTYQVDRSFRYQGKDGFKTVHNTSAKLLDLSEEEPSVLADRPTEVTQECIRLLGLNSEDFMRTVVLPQGQFSEFLKLKNRERRGMLQRIFHLEQYGEELNRKIGAARIRQELSISNLEGELKSYSDVSKEEIARNEEALQAVQENYEKGAEQQKALTAHFQEKDAVRSLLNEYEPLLDRHHNLLLRQEQVDKDSLSLQITKKANQLKPLIEQARRAAEEHRSIAHQLSELNRQYTVHQENFEQIRRGRETFLEEYAVAYPTLIEHGQRLQTASQLSASIKDYQKKKDTARKSIETDQTLLKQLEQKKSQMMAQEDTLKREILSLEKEAEALRFSQELREQLEKGHILEEQYREKRDHYERMRKSADIDAARIREASKKQESIVRQADAIYAKGQDQLLVLKDQMTKLEADSRHLSIEKAENDALLSAYQKDHMASILRSSLQEGGICPVCGHVHHADEAAAHETNHRQPTETDKGVNEKRITSNKSGIYDPELLLIKKCEKKRDNLQKKELELRADHTRLSQVTDTLTREMDALHKLITDSELSKSASLEQSSDYSPDTDSASLQRAPAMPSTESTKASLSDSILSNYQSSEKLLNEARAITERCSFGAASLRTLDDTYQRSSEELKENYRLLSQSLTAIYELRKQLHVENCSKELQRYRQMEVKAQEIRKQIQDHRHGLEQLTKDKEFLQDSISITALKVEGSVREHDSYETFIEEQRKRFPEGISPDADHESLLKQSQKDAQALKEQNTTLEKEYQQMETQNQALREQVLAAKSNEQQSARYAEETAALALQQKTALGFDEDFSPEDWYLTDTEIRSIEEKIEEFKKTLGHTRERLHYLEEKLAGRTCSPEEWQSAKEELEQITACNKELQQQISVLEHKKQSLAERFTIKQALEKDLQKASHRHDLILQLAKLFKGNTFIEYMAESRLRYIAIEASHILSDISGGDYSLEVNESAEFVIRDNKNGGNLRPCDTLSGGETFITSLSLALSLSSAIQLNGTAPLELFFLDEGFGSLDSDLLEVVMTSLEHLKNRKRSIGIITHVEAIRSRVPVKLSVIPSEEGESGSKIIMEYT